MSSLFCQFVRTKVSIFFALFVEEQKVPSCRSEGSEGNGPPDVTGGTRFPLALPFALWQPSYLVKPRKLLQALSVTLSKHCFWMPKAMASRASGQPLAARRTLNPFSLGLSLSELKSRESFKNCLQASNLSDETPSTRRQNGSNLACKHF